MLFEFMRKEVESGGGDIKERECLLGGRENLSGGGKWAGWDKKVNIGFHRRFWEGHEGNIIRKGGKSVGEEKVVELMG